MNRIFRLVWNRALGTVQVASELARAPRGGAQAASDMPLPRYRALAMACAAALGLTLSIAPAWAACPGTSIAATGTTGTQGVDGVGNGTQGGKATDGGDAATAGSNGQFCVDVGNQAVGGNGGRGGYGAAGSGSGASPGFGGNGGVGGNGGYGVHGTGSFLLANYGSIAGGAGGVGGGAGRGSNYGGNGGNGGNGGTGLSGTGFVLNNTGSITGGGGGVGGHLGLSDKSYFGHAGQGGQGGAAIRSSGVSQITNSGSITGGAGAKGGKDFYGVAGGGLGGMGGAGLVGDGFQLTNTSSITGGAGGAGGEALIGGVASNGGRGGDAVQGSNLLITNAGSISGGQAGAAGDGTLGTYGLPGSSGDAVHFTGGGNTLTLNSGSVLNGAVEIDSGSTATINANAAGLDLSGGTLGSDALIVNGTAQVDLNASALAISGNISGTGTLNIVGVGHALTLGTVNIGGLNSNASTTLVGGVTTSGGGQTYSGAVTLGAHTVTSDTQGGSISFNAIDGQRDLVVDTSGSVFFNGPVGAIAALSSLTTNNASQIMLGGNVSTIGDQLYEGPVTLTGNVTASTPTSGNVDFESKVDGRFALNVNAGGATTFTRSVGGQTRLLSLSTGSAGTTQLGANIATSGGGQFFGNTVVLNSNVTLSDNQNGNIGFGSTIDGTYNLTINTGGMTDFEGVIGGTEALNNIDVTSGGILLNRSWNVMGVALHSSGGIAEMPGATLVTNLLTGSSAGQTTLNTGTNAIDTIGSFSANGFSLINSQAVSVFFDSTLDGGTGDVSLTTTNGNIYVNQGATITGANINLTAAGITDLSGRLSTPGTITVNNPLRIETGSAIVGNLVINGGIDFFNTDSISLAGVVSGGADLNVHTGNVDFQGINSYTGATILNGGNVSLSGSGSISTSAYVLISNPSTFDISGTNNGALIATLAGSGKVTLGNQSLTLTNAANTYKGIISGTGGFVLSGGTEVFTGANTYTGTTTIASGTLQLGNGGMIAGNVVDNGKLTFNTNQNVTFAGNVSGTGSLAMQGGGFVTLTGNNTYAGNTTVSSGSVLQIGNNGTSGSVAGNVADSGTLIFNRGDDLRYAGVISGTGLVSQVGAGVLTLDGKSGSHSGQVNVAGSLIVGSVAGNGAALGGSITVQSNGTLGGQGSVGSAGKTLNVSAGGTLAPGDLGSTLYIVGNLNVAQGGILDYQYGAPGANFQTPGAGSGLSVSGNVTLGGATLNIADAGGMGPGLYNVLTYGGSLSGSGAGLILGNTAGQTLAVQYLTAQKQVNLIDTTGLTLGFWNANGQASSTQMGGGSGTWSTTSPMWTDMTGSVTNAAMQPQPGMAIFGGTPGTVTVDDSVGTVATTGMQFATDGYTLTGSALDLVGSGGTAPIIRVGDGSSAGAGMTAVIANSLTGTDGLTKSDLGTLVLTGNSTYTGGTTIAAGTLQIGNGGTSGSVAGDIVDNGTLAFNRSDATTFAGTISGSGTVVQAGSGGVALASDNTYTGGTTIAAGTLALSGNGSVAASSGVIDNGMFDISATNNGASIATLSGQGTVELGNRALTLTDAGDTFDGVIQGSGSLTLAGGHETLTGNNSYTGGTTIGTGSSLQIGDGGSSGRILGNVVDDGALVFNRSDNVVYTSTISGGGSLHVMGSSSLMFLGDNTYTGGTTVDANASLYLGAGNTHGMIVGDVVNDGLFVVQRNDDVSFAGTISGGGQFQQFGTGTLTLTGNNSYTGLTLISDGTLALAGTGSIAASSAIVDFAAFDISGTDQGASITDLGGTGTVNLGARTLTLTQANDQFTGVISGSGGLTLAGGTEKLTGANAYTGITTITSGTLQLGNGGTTGSVAGDIVDNGGLVFDRSDNVVFGGNISGSGSLTQSGSGNLILTSNNSYTGRTVIAGGGLQIGNGGTTGAIAGDVVDNGRLTFDRTDTLSYAGAITGSGAMNQQGSGVLILAGNSSYQGGTTIGAGTLQIGDGGTTGAITGDVLNQGKLVFDRSDTVHLDGELSGQGELIQQGHGALVLDGNSSSFAGNTTVTDGTLSIGSVAGNGAALGGNVTVQTGASLGGHGAIGGDVTLQSGSSLAPGAAGSTLTVHGDLVAAQGSRFDFQFGAPGSNFLVAGTGDSVRVDGDVTLNGVELDVTNAGGMGAGIYNVLTYGGALNQTQGGLVLGNGTGPAITLQYLSAQKQINLVDTAGLTLSFWNANGQASSTQMGGGSGTWSATSRAWTDANGAIPNSIMQPQPGMAVFGGTPGAVTVSNSDGNVAALGLQFATDGYTLTGDALQLIGSNGAAPVIRVGDGSSAGTGMTATVTNVLTGSDGLAKNDLGTLVLTGNSIYTGGTTINAGSLQLGNGGNSGMIAGDVANNGTLAFDHGDDIAFAGTISGSGALTQLGSGSVTLTADNTYAGGTVIAAGTLRIGNGGGSGSIVGNIRDDGALVFDRGDTLIFAGAIAGQGSLMQAGAGTLILNGDSSAFAGSTTVQSGTLEIGDAATPSASLGGKVTVAGGATLRGHGSVTGNVTNNGTVWAGGSIGTLTIKGNYTQTAAGTLNVDAMPGGQASLLAISGSANLAGSALVLEGTGQWSPQTSYTILTAGNGIAGQFASIQSSLAFLDPTLSYGANALTLSLQRNDVNFSSVAQTPNQAGVAAAANGLGAGNSVYDALVVLDASTARHAFEQLDGQIHASLRTAIMDDERYVRDAVTDHLLDWNQGNGSHEGRTDDGTAVWTAAWAHSGSQDGNGNTSTLDASGGGMLLGVDTPVGERARVGGVIGAGDLSNSLGALDSSAHGRTRHAGIYASLQAGGFRLMGGAIYGRQTLTTHRSIAFPGLVGPANGSYDADTVQGYLDGSYVFAIGRGTLAPFVDVAAQRLHTDGFNETGIAALDGRSQTNTQTYGTAGLRGTVQLDDRGTVQAHASVGWQHAWGDVIATSALQFAGGGDVFTTQGAPTARNAATVTAGLRFLVTPSLTLDAGYDGQFARRVDNQSARISLSYAF